MADYSRKAVKNTAMVFGMLFFSMVVTYILRMVLARKLTLSEYGIFYSAIALFSFLITIVRDLGLRHALVKFIPEFIAKKQRGRVKGVVYSVAYVHLAISLVVFGIMILFSDMIASLYFKDIALSGFVKLLALFFFVSFAQEIITYAIQGSQRMGWFSSEAFVRMSFVLIFSLIFLKMGLGLFAPLWAYILTYVILPMFYLPVLSKVIFKGFFKFKTAVDKKMIREMFSFGIFNMLALTYTFIISYSDTIILTIMTSFNDVGLYQAAQPASNLVWFVASAAAMMILPLSSELWAKKEKKVLARLMFSIHKNVFILTAPITIFFVVFSTSIMTLLYTPEYAPAALTLSILSVGGLFYAISLINFQVIAGTGHPKINMKITLTAGLANILLNIILIPFFGMNGAAFGTSLIFFVVFVVSTVKLNKLVGFNQPWTNWIKISLVSLLTAATTYLVMQAISLPLIPKTLICLAFGGGVYSLLLFALKITSIREIREIFAKIF